MTPPPLKKTRIAGYVPSTWTPSALMLRIHSPPSNGPSMSGALQPNATPSSSQAPISHEYQNVGKLMTCEVDSRGFPPPAQNQWASYRDRSGEGAKQRNDFARPTFSPHHGFRYGTFTTEAMHTKEAGIRSNEKFSGGKVERRNASHKSNYFSYTDVDFGEYTRPTYKGSSRRSEDFDLETDFNMRHHEGARSQQPSSGIEGPQPRRRARPSPYEETNYGYGKIPRNFYAPLAPQDPFLYAPSIPQDSTSYAPPIPQGSNLAGPTAKQVIFSAVYERRLNLISDDGETQIWLLDTSPNPSGDDVMAALADYDRLHNAATGPHFVPGVLLFGMTIDGKQNALVMQRSLVRWAVGCASPFARAALDQELLQEYGVELELAGLSTGADWRWGSAAFPH